MTDTLASPNGHATRVAHSPAVPPAMADDFRQFRGAADGTYWQFGDRIDAWVVELAGRLSQARVYRAAATETDLSVGEVRKLHETARATDPQLRDEFGDVLTHEHYRVVRYVDDRARQRAYLRLAVESADSYGGRPMPAAKLAAQVRADSGREDPPPSFGELLDRAVKALERARDAAEDEQHERLNRIIAQVEKLL